MAVTVTNIAIPPILQRFALKRASLDDHSGFLAHRLAHRLLKPNDVPPLECHIENTETLEQIPSLISLY